MQQKKQRDLGDFQTPTELTDKIMQYALELINPKSIVEPTCGKGNFINSAIQHTYFANIYGFEVQEHYVKELQKNIRMTDNVQIIHANYFTVDWQDFYRQLEEPILLIGNPPWITNTELSTLKSNNIPDKNNYDNLLGMSALTGKSNFDISEYIIRDQIQNIYKKNSLLVMICKISVARKILKYCWKNTISVSQAEIQQISAPLYFDAKVAACVLILRFHGTPIYECTIFQEFIQKKKGAIGFRQNRLIANTTLFDMHKHLLNKQKSQHLIWRSGVKHDASKVMELLLTPKGYINRLHESVDVEEELIYPLFKSTDIYNEVQKPDRFIIITQKKVGADTSHIATDHPKLWKYLNEHNEYFTRRKSIVYKNKPMFSIFGVGDYTFQPWKIAISGLHKKLKFRKIKQYNNKPVIFDDTCYFLAFDTEQKADLIIKILKSKEVQEFYESLVFWDEKRPIKAELLNTLDLMRLIQ